MTCIAWDGRTLAADRQATLDGRRRPVTKLYDLKDALPAADGEHPGRRVLVAVTGDHECALGLVEWVRGGEDPAKWPAYQKHDSFNTLIVIRLNHKFQPILCMYEAEPIRQVLFTDEPFAWGVDAGMALAAMAAGATALQAVEIAGQLSIYSGLGVDTLAVSAL